MAWNRNSESRRDASASPWWNELDGEDDEGLPDEPYEPDEPWEPDDDGLPSPHCRPGEQTWVEAELERRARGEAARHSLPGEPRLAHELAPQDPDYGLPPEEAEARHRQGLTGPPKRTGTGFYYRNGDEIPPTHPDHGPMHLIPRQADGSFAAYYYCSKAELARGAELPPPPPRRYRRDGFNVERQQQFAEHLRDTASWKDAARLTGISRTAAYNLYNSPDGAAFRALVAEALKGTDLLLESTALDRAVNGQEEIVYYKGERVGVRWKYDNKLLTFLLRARNPLKYAPLSEIEGWLARRGLEPPADLPAALDRLAAAEAEWGRTLPGEGDPPPALARPGDGAPAPPAIEGPGPAASSAATGPEANDPPVVSTSSTSMASEAAVESTSSTSPTPGPTDANDPLVVSTSSTSAADEASVVSTLSTSTANEAAVVSTLSTLPTPGPTEEPPLEPGMPIPFRPPPRPRFAPD